jgi:hypothetical protein
MPTNSSTYPSRAEGRSSAGKTTPHEHPSAGESKDFSSEENQMLKVLRVFDIDRCRIAQFHAGMWWEEG